MSKHARSFTPAPDGTVTLNTGLEAFQSSPEFRGPVEDVDGHGCNDHFAQIYETDEERFAAAVPFVRHGLERGERVMYVIDKSSEEEVTAALRNGGIDVDAARESGALSFHTVQETYLRNGEFAPDEMIDFYGETVDEVTDEYAGLRIVAETTWLQDDSASVEEFMEYESKVNELFAETDSLAVCQYERDGFPPEVIRNLVQSHPHLIYDGAVCHNVYYTPPAEFFEEDAPAREVDRMLGTLHERTTAKTELQHRDRFLRELYEITADADRSFDEKVQALFDLGRDLFDMELGAMARVNPETDRFEVECTSHDHPHFEPGLELELSETYCTAATDAGGPAEVTDPEQEGYDDIFVRWEFGIQSYLGTHLTVSGDDNRTFFFVTSESRDDPVTETERIALDLMGQWVEHELERQQREQFLRACYEITASQDRSFEEKLDALFELGCEQFNIGFGFLNRVDPAADHLEIEYATDDHPDYKVGGELPLSETYCKAAVDIEAAADITNPVDDGFDDIHVYEEFGVDAYLGTYIPVEGDADRTLAFVPESTSETEFSEQDKAFIELMGQWIGYELNRRQREQFLRECYEITADPTRGFEDKLHRLLDLARDRMGVELGGLSHLPESDGEFLTEYAINYGGDGDGTVTADDCMWTDPSEGCYCRQVIESDEPVGMADVRGTPWEDEEIHQEQDLACYLGTKVTSGSTPYGTLWVGDTEPRDREFTETERTLLELIGQWVSYEVERREHNEAQRELYEITSDPGRSFEEQLDALFELGCEQFGLDLGGMAKVYPEADQLEVEYVSEEHEEIKPGLEAPLRGAYCGAAYGADGAATVTDPVAAGYGDSYSHTELGVEAYLGTHIEVEDDHDRLFFFTTADPRDGVSDVEQTFLDLMSQWVQYELERRQREQELRERTDHLNALIDTTSDCIKTVAPDGTLLQMNDAGLEMVEAPAESAVIGENVYDLIAPEDRERFEAFNERICSGERGTLEFDIIGLEGTRRHMETHAAPLDHPDGDTVQVAVTRDITERKERERDLEQYETVAETASDVILTMDDEGRIRNVNPAVADVFGYEPAALEAEPLTTLMPDRFAADHEAGFAQYLQTGERTLDWEYIELPGVHADGTEIPLAISFSEYEYDGDHYFTGIVRDITEREEREQELRQTKDRFETVFEQSDDGIFILDPDADELVDANPKAAEMTGYTRDELLSLAPSDLHSDEMEQFRAFLEEARETGSAWSEDLHCRHKNGHDIPAEITASPITLDGRDLVLANVRHIEDRKKHERYQRELYDTVADVDTSFDEKLDRLLELGRERFGLKNGYFNRVDTDADEFEVVAAVGPHDMIEPGAVDSLTGTYCGEHLDTAAPLAVADAGDAGLEDLRACTEYELEAYIAATVHVGSEEYGTLCFASETPRDKPFTDAEQTFLDLMSQWVQYELERREHNQSQRELYEITADPALDTGEKIEQLLAVGREHLGLPVGMLNRDTGDAVEIERMHGDLPALEEGARSSPESDKYCRKVIDTGEPVTVADAAAVGWTDDPMYKQADLEAYAGVPVTVGGSIYGTMAFMDTAPREAPFTDAEQAFLDLMGRCVGYELDQARRETRLHALNTLGLDLMSADSPAAVGDAAMDAVANVCDLPVAALVTYDEDTGELRPAASTDAAADLMDATSLFERPDGAVWEAFVNGDVQKVDDPAPCCSESVPPVTGAVAYPLGNHGVFFMATVDPHGFRANDYEALETSAVHMRAALARADREQQLQEREQALEEQNETLARLNRVNDTIRSVDQALVEARTRDEIERVVCEELADRGPYELAWIGEYDGAIGEVTPVTSAGTDKGYLDRITVTADDTQEGCGPTGRAIKTGDPQVVNDVISDESYAPWRQDALNRGFHASAALPLTYDDSQYGVLNLYAGQPGVFDDLEREVLTELSNTVAHAINAVESKKSLVSPTVDELEFEVTDDALALVAMARALDCDAELKRLVPRDDGRINMFFAVDGATPDEVLAFQAELPTTDIRVVSEGDDGSPCLFEAELTDESLGQTVTDHGGRLRRVHIEDGVAQVIVRLGQDADTREFVEMFRTKYLDSELVANRTRPLSHQTPFEFAETMMDDLTGRQREALQTAYFSGYFEEPRNRTASEIADIMDIAQPTFNSHLRAAMRKVYRRIFEDELAAE